VTPSIAITIAILGAYLAHFLTTKRFKNELLVKKSEKNIFDAKEIIDDFERKLSTRIYYTRDYLFTLRKAKHDKKNIDPNYREEYKKLIKDWNLSFDYMSSQIKRKKVLNDSANEIEKIQSKLRTIHVFLAMHADNPGNASYNEIDKKIEEIKNIQTESYSIITRVNENIDNRWFLIFKKDNFISKCLYLSFDYILKTLTLYIIVCIVLFVYELLSLLFQ